MAGDYPYELRGVKVNFNNINNNLKLFSKTEYIFQIILQNEINLNFKKMNLIHKFMENKGTIIYNKSYFL